MKRFCLIVVALLFPIVVCAQQVTTFLGIPVDGSKSEMIQKLKAKGFRSTATHADVLEGEFNGQNVYIIVKTNKDKVYRIAVTDINSIDEASIRIRFNRLLKQFEDNDKYVASLLGNSYISDDEDISYEITVKSRRYEASFYQRTELLDSALLNAYNYLKTRYTESQLVNATDAMATDILEYTKLYLEPYLKTSVWFMISEAYQKGKYYISLFYDNEYNMANGEDL